MPGSPLLLWPNEKAGATEVDGAAALLVLGLPLLLWPNENVGAAVVDGAAELLVS